VSGRDVLDVLEELADVAAVAAADEATEAAVRAEYELLRPRVIAGRRWAGANFGFRWDRVVGDFTTAVEAFSDGERRVFTLEEWKARGPE
jgi:hypothetical protein